MTGPRMTGPGMTGPGMTGPGMTDQYMADGRMSDSLVIQPRFRGPPDSGNGGYVCGLVAARVGGQAQVTLRRPPRLAVPLSVERDSGGTVRVLDGGALVAEGVIAPDGPAVELPEPVPVGQASVAGARCHLRARPEEHPFPGCFVCGPDRAPGDGLRILVGPVTGRDGLSADVWTPGAALADGGGQVRPEFVWAALDCAGGVGTLGDSVPAGPPFLLGRLTVNHTGPVVAGEPHVVTGWLLRRDGRKILAGSALFTADGEAVAIAQATWIQLA
jgi:hypothetical protein